MNNPVPHYDLLPLRWWENPWTVGFIIIAIIFAIIVTCWVWRIVRARKARPLHPLDQWLLDLHGVRKNIQSQEHASPMVYHHLVKVVREYAQTYHAVHQVSYTDEEFMHALKIAPVKASDLFLDITACITRDAYQVKFANTTFPTDHVENCVTALIGFLEQEKRALSIFPPK